jgi:hypothetical protein
VLAKVRGPLFSLQASGKFAKTVSYAAAKQAKTLAKLAPKPANPKTVAQQAARQNVANGVQSWHDFIRQGTAADLQAWRQLANNATLGEGYSAYMQHQIKLAHDGHKPIGHLSHFEILNSHNDQMGVNITCSEGEGFLVFCSFGTSPLVGVRNVSVLSGVDGVCVFQNIETFVDPGKVCFVTFNAPTLFVRSGLYRVKMSF